jgi:hypothetical protein
MLDERAVEVLIQLARRIVGDIEQRVLRKRRLRGKHAGGERQKGGDAHESVLGGVRSPAP